MKRPIRNIAIGLSTLVLFFFILSYYSHLVYNAALDGKNSGFIAHHLTNFANYPNKIEEVLTSTELAGIPSTYLKLDANFKEVNTLSYNLYAVNSFWNTDGGYWDIKLFNLRQDSVLYNWKLKKNGLNFETTHWVFSNAVPRSCLILPDKSLILSADESANLMRLDAQSNVMWINHDLIFHHTMNFGEDSTIWTCTSDPEIKGNIPVKGIQNFNGNIYRYRENYITQLDKNTGKIIFHKGVSDILKENHYKNFLCGVSDPDKYPYDPMHLNDIQPLLKDSKHWKKGDLLLSLRDRSLILLYRPSTNKIIRLIFGEFLNQHDPNVISDDEISIFNNNYIQHENDTLDNVCIITDTLCASEIMIYNFNDSTFTRLLNNHLIKEKIWTETQGVHRILKNGDIFIESQNKGKLYILNKSGFVYKKMLHAPLENYAYHTNWIRIYEQIPY
ncbi:MAG: hypothetical protein JWM14_1353 [Chitinophagaceae bacterium]|nr:hypothetical protein [Chitinophagaceae bacterium]